MRGRMGHSKNKCERKGPVESDTAWKKFLFNQKQWAPSCFKMNHMKLLIGNLFKHISDLCLVLKT